MKKNHESYVSRASLDLEKARSIDAAFRNDEVHALSWSNLSVLVPSKDSNSSKKILDNVSGICLPGMCLQDFSGAERTLTSDAGDVVAIMGPSGSGKTTLLNTLARRSTLPIRGEMLVNGAQQPISVMRRVSAYVEQEDNLIGSLTAEETITFAAKLALGRSVAATEIQQRVNYLLDAFGLASARKTLVGTPIQRGLSGGQKRRVSVASQLITAPRIVFLDEMTSGLDSRASYEVVKYVREAAKRYKLIVIASIHQPSTKTLALFDKVALLSRAQTCYFGPTDRMPSFFWNVGLPVPQLTNPAEHVLDVINTDFDGEADSSRKSFDAKLVRVQEGWKRSQDEAELSLSIRRINERVDDADLELSSTHPSTFLHQTLVLTHRSFVKSYRDMLAYHIRLVMYTALALMMGTVWLRLPAVQSSIQPFINAIFFGSAFMSFMAVAYVPAFLEDRASFVRERANGLYGAIAFTLANFVTGLPYLFLISIVFSTIAYWLTGFQPAADRFFTWVLLLFLDLLAAESMVFALASLLPNFVVALAVIAFANGLWMCVGGFLVSPTVLNVFWRYVFHYIDYQAYVFQGMMVNEFTGRRYGCGDGCQCMYEPVAAGVCEIDGVSVLETYGYHQGRIGEWVGILVGIIAFYRLAGLVINWCKKH